MPDNILMELSELIPLIPWRYVLVGVVLLVAYKAVFIIPNTAVGVVEKRWSFNGSVVNGLIALNGQAGFQPATLRGGIHVLMPWQYVVHRMPLVTIPQGKIGYIFARDGLPLDPKSTLAEHLSDITDVVAFLKKGGQRGPQRQILREGTYALNLAQFVILTDNRQYYLPLDGNDRTLFSGMAQLIAERQGFEALVIRNADDVIGIVTVHDGPSLPAQEIIAPVVGDNPQEANTYHNKFQDPDRFLAAGGMRGRQLQVLVDGTYYINRLFATVELIKQTVIEIGHAGVVISYTGALGQDLSGTDYKHGELVETGRCGVWRDPLLPGK